MPTTVLSEWVVVSLRFGRHICGLALVLIALSGSASAQGNSGGHKHRKPEIDPGSLKGSLILLGGGVLLVTDRFWRRRKT